MALGANVYALEYIGYGLVVLQGSLDYLILH